MTRQTKQNEPWKLNKQNVDITVFLNWKTKNLDIKIDASKCFMYRKRKRQIQKFELNSNSTFMESLILAQDERWRRA